MRVKKHTYLYIFYMCSVWAKNCISMETIRNKRNSTNTQSTIVIPIYDGKKYTQKNKSHSRFFFPFHTHPKFNIV